MMTNDCVGMESHTISQSGGGSPQPCGCIEATRWGSVKHGEVYPAWSFLVENNGVLEPWADLTQKPVAFTQKGFDTSAETAAVSKGVWYAALSSALRIQTDALHLPAGIDEPKAMTKLRAAGFEILDLTGSPL